MNWFSKIMALCVLFSLLYLLLPACSLRKSVGAIMAVVLSLQFLTPFFTVKQHNITSWLFSLTGEQVFSEDTNENMNEIFDAYEEKCRKEIQTYVLQQENVSFCAVEIMINRDVQSNSMGSIEHIYLYVSFAESEEKDSSWIEPIEIILGNRWKNESNGIQQKNELKKSVSTWLSVDLNSISIFDKEEYHA